MIGPPVTKPLISLNQKFLFELNQFILFYLLTRIS